MDDFLNFLWLAFKCSWPILAIFAIYAIIFITGFFPPKNSIPAEKIRAVEIELHKKWAQEEAEKQKVSNQSNRSQDSER